jgi:hypothetical protein
MGAIKRWHIALMMIVLFLMGLVVPAQATEPPSERSVGVELVTTWETPKVTAAGKSICATQTMTNVFGQTLWTWKNCRYWEYNGTRVTNAPSFTATFTRTGLGEFWVYDGVIDSSAWYSNCSGNHNQSCHTRYRMAQMRLVVAGQTIQSVYPWVRVKVGWQGQWWGDGGR